MFGNYTFNPEEYYQIGEGPYEIAEEFSGKCKRCNKEGSVKILLSKHRKTDKVNMIGPFHKLCAYEVKFRKIPPYNTLPTNRREFLYRYLTSSELPDRPLVNQTLLRMTYTIVVSSIFWICLASLLIFIYMQTINSVSSPISQIMFYFFLTGILYSIIFILLPTTDKIDNIVRKREISRFKYVYHDLSRKEFISTTLVMIRSSIEPIIYLFLLAILVALVLGLSLVALQIYSVIFLYLLPFAIIPLVYEVIKKRKIIQKYYKHFLVILRQLLPNSSFGKDYRENFSLFWSGKVNLEDRDQSYYRKIVFVNILFVAVVITIQVVYPNFTVFPVIPNIITSQEVYYYPVLRYLGINYIRIFEIMNWLIIIACINLVIYERSGTFVMYSDMPKDIHEMILENYRKSLAKSRQVKQSIGQQANITKSIFSVFGFGRSKGSKSLACPICKVSLREDDVISQCNSCLSIYHSPHLRQYIANRVEKNRDPECPICKNSLVE